LLDLENERGGNIARSADLAAGRPLSIAPPRSSRHDSTPATSTGTVPQRARREGDQRRDPSERQRDWGNNINP
jgi:hypothetical protein